MGRDWHDTGSLKGKGFTWPQRAKSTPCGVWGALNISILLGVDFQEELLTTDWLLLHLMKSPFGISLKAGQMICSYIISWTSQQPFSCACIHQMIWISAAPSGPVIRASALPDETLLEIQIYVYHPNLLNPCLWGRVPGFCVLTSAPGDFFLHCIWEPLILIALYWLRTCMSFSYLLFCLLATYTHASNFKAW